MEKGESPAAPKGLGAKLLWEGGGRTGASKQSQDDEGNFFSYLILCYTYKASVAQGLSSGLVNMTKGISNASKGYHDKKCDYCVK